MWFVPWRGPWSAGCLSSSLHHRSSASLLPHRHLHLAFESVCSLITWCMQEDHVSANIWHSKAAVCLLITKLTLKHFSRLCRWKGVIRGCVCEPVFWSVLSWCLTSGPGRTDTGSEDWEESRQSLPLPWRQYFSLQSPTGRGLLCTLHLEMKIRAVLKLDSLFIEWKKKAGCTKNIFTAVGHSALTSDNNCLWDISSTKQNSDD